MEYDYSHYDCELQENNNDSKMSQINTHKRTNIIQDENDATMIKTPYKPASSARHTPLLSNTPRSLFAKPTSMTPGLPKTFLSNASLKTPVHKPNGRDEEEEEEMIEEVASKSPAPHLLPVDEEDDDEIDTCVGHPINNITEDDYEYMKDFEDVGELYDPSIESFRKIYGDPADLVVENFSVRLPDSPIQCKYQFDEHDDFFGFIQYADPDDVLPEEY